MMTSLEELYLDGNRITELDAGTFVGLANLRSLSLAHNSLVELRKEVLEPVSQLQQLDLSYNRVKIVLKNNFFGLLRLRELKLDHNEIRVIEDEAFAVTIVNTKSQLTWLYLNDNAVSRIDTYTLYGIPYLKYCNLAGNRIESIEEAGLSKLRRLYTLVLSNNTISHLSVAVFKHLQRLQRLSLDGNRIRHLPAGVFTGLDRLEELDLSRNEIELIQPRTFTDTPRLLTISLRRNRLRSIDLGILDVVLRVKYVILSSNMIDRVTMPRTPRRSLVFMSLSDNNLSTLSENVAHTMAFDSALELHGNPWSCDCNIRWMLDAARKSGVQLTKSNVVCKSPPAFSGDKVGSRNPNDS